MPIFSLNVFSNSAVGLSAEALGPISNATVTAVQTMRVLDNDPVFQDESTFPPSPRDSDGEQVLAENFGPYPAGRAVQSVYLRNFTNATTGETGTAYLIRIYTGTSNTNPGAQDGEYYWASNIAVRAGDVVTLGTTTNPDGTINYSSLVACFAAGTQVATPDGKMPVEKLRPGQLVTTADHGNLPVRWVGIRRLTAEELAKSPNLTPIRIARGALGNDLPSRELVVSPQHRMLVASAVAEDEPCLCAAKHLVGLPGITVASDLQGVTYVHFMFDAHQVVFAEGAATESMYAGKEAIAALSDASRTELFEIFPDLAMTAGDTAVHKPARRFLTGREGRALVQRAFAESHIG